MSWARTFAPGATLAPCEPWISEGMPCSWKKRLRAANPRIPKAARDGSAIGGLLDCPTGVQGDFWSRARRGGISPGRAAFELTNTPWRPRSKTTQSWSELRGLNPRISRHSSGDGGRRDAGKPASAGRESIFGGGGTLGAKLLGRIPGGPGGSVGPRQQVAVESAYFISGLSTHEALKMETVL